MNFKLIIVTLLFLLPLKNIYAQFNGRYFSYSDSTILKYEIKEMVESIVFFTDSLKQANDFHYKVKYYVGLYSPDSSIVSVRWRNTHKQFYNLLKRKVGKKYVFRMNSHQGPYNDVVDKVYIGVCPIFTGEQESH